MHILPFRAPSPKANRNPPHADPCPACGGSGLAPDGHGDPVPCDDCHGDGMAPLILEGPRTEGEYIATSLDGMLDAEKVGHLDLFLERLLADWPQLDGEDIAVWLLEHGMGPRVVCVLRPGPDGNTTVTYL